MNESKDRHKTEKNGTTRKRRIIIGAVVAVVAIIALVKVPSIIAESGELLQILPGIPGVISSIGNGAVAEKADLKPVEAAIIASTPRVISVYITNNHSGFAEVVDVTLSTNDPLPITQEELTDVLKAIWQTIPFEPNSITIGAITGPQQVVDVKYASNKLPGVNVMDHTNNVTITKLSELLGPWKKPR